MNGLLNRLLGRHLNAWQLAGFVLANLCGMAIVLAAVQLYGDVKPIFTGGDSFLREGHIVLTKHVNTLGSLTGSSTAFSEKEIKRLDEQPFVRSVGRYTPAQFAVFATIGVGSMRYSTEMFFESVPDEFLDVDLSEWSYDPDGTDVPIILPRTYLNLYNFGFASSQGLPTVSEGMVSTVDVNLRLSGRRDVLLKTGHVVAFSRRLNTILVPQAFMEDMNRRLAPDREPQASRLIVRVDNPADDRIADYLTRYHYDTEADDADTARAASFLRLLISAVLLVGLIISALAFYVLLLSIFLLLQKQTEKIDNLLLIGYSPAYVARPFHLLTVGLNLVVLVGAFLLVRAARGWYLPLLGRLYEQYEPSSFLPVLLTGLALFALVTVLNFIAIRRKVTAIWHMHE